MGFFTLLSISLMSFVGCADLLKLSQDTREKLIEIEKKQNEHDITSMLPPIESLCEYCSGSI